MQKFLPGLEKNGFFSVFIGLPELFCDPTALNRLNKSLQIDEELLVPLVEKSMKICISDGRFGGHSDARGCADDAERLQTPLEFKILV